MSDKTTNTHLLTQNQKDSNDKAYYREQAQLLNTRGFSGLSGYMGSSEYKRMKVNYELFGNKVNLSDFSHVMQPFGADVGELPATLTNRDISSRKLKVLHGMEMRRPFNFKVIAVNEEATTRKEQVESGLIRDFVVAQVMQPIRQQVELQYQEQTKGRQLSPDEQKQIQQEIEQEVAAKQPDEVKKYMLREHQDPAEALGHQLLEYLTQKEKVKDKFHKGWKHSTISGKEIYYAGIFNREPGVRVVNPMSFDCDNGPDQDYIEDGQWAKAEYRFTPAQIVSYFGRDLTKEEIEKVYNLSINPSAHLTDASFSFSPQGEGHDGTILCKHFEWKGLRKIKWVTYIDEETGEEEVDLQSEYYKLNPEAGDISIEEDWIPEVHETWMIGNDIFVGMQPVPGQHRDLDNIYECKLSYIGALTDDMNTGVTAIMDRITPYQYLYNIIWYRLELLLASDKGKVLAMNVNAIPKKQGINTEQWLYYVEATKTAWYDPTQEGYKGTGNAGEIAHVLDMSVASDIQNYINMLEYIDKACGESVGVTKSMEGSIGDNEAVTNTKQNIIQSSYIIEPYFALHNIVKGNVLSRLLEVAKVAYTYYKPKKLSYVLDDMSIKMLEIDYELLDQSTYGLYVEDSMKANEAKDTIVQLAHAAMQNAMLDMSDVIKVIKTEGLQSAEEALEIGEAKKRAENQAQSTATINAQKEADELTRQHEKEQWAHEADMIVLKEEERRKTEIQKAAVVAMGFNEEKDADNDGTPDVMEVADHMLNVQDKTKKLIQKDRDLDIREKQLEHQKEVDKKKLEQGDKKLEIDRKKANKPTTSKK